MCAAISIATATVGRPLRVVIDDYISASEKVRTTGKQVDALVAEGRLVSLGFYGGAPGSADG